MSTPIKLPTFRDGLNRAMTEAMRADENVFVFGLDVPDHKRIFGSTLGLVEEFGSKRVFGTPLAEDGMTGVALGAAISGLRPIHVHIRVDFMLLAMNQIANMVSNIRYMTGGELNVPLVLRAVIGRGWGQAAQHSKSMQSVFAHIPGLKVVMPSSPQDAYSLLRSAIEDNNPVLFLEHRWLYDIEGKIDFNQKIPLGTAAKKREGKDLTLIATSWMTVEAMHAASILAKRNIELEVIDVRTITPCDWETIEESVTKTGRAIVADYDWTFCGFASEVAAHLQEHCFEALEKPVARIGFAPVPCPTTRPLENLFYPSAVQIVRKVEELLNISPTDLSGESFYSYENQFRGPF